MNLNGAKILITGGGTGIGRALAESLTQRSAQVAICGRREAPLREAAQATGAHPFVCDVGNEEQVRSTVAQVREALGGLDVLINNAGFGYHAPLLELDVERAAEVWSTNVKGAMLCAREAARGFVGDGGGTIVNVGSTAAGKGYPGGSAYASSKFALSALTECWRAELREHGVRVMQVDPSEVVTPFGGRVDLSENPSKLRAEDVAQLVESLLCLDDRGFVTRATLWATNPR